MGLRSRSNKLQSCIVICVEEAMGVKSAQLLKVWGCLMNMWTIWEMHLDIKTIHMMIHTTQAGEITLISLGEVKVRIKRNFHLDFNSSFNNQRKSLAWKILCQNSSKHLRLDSKQLRSLRNQEVSIHNLENQIDQLANLIFRRQQGSFPRNIKLNPKEHAKAVALRGGKELRGGEFDNLTSEEYNLQSIAQ